MFSAQVQHNNYMRKNTGAFFVVCMHFKCALMQVSNPMHTATRIRRTHRRARAHARTNTYACICMQARLHTKRTNVEGVTEDPELQMTPSTTRIAHRIKPLLKSCVLTPLASSLMLLFQSMLPQLLARSRSYFWRGGLPHVSFARAQCFSASTLLFTRS